MEEELVDPYKPKSSPSYLRGLMLAAAVASLAVTIAKMALSLRRLCRRVLRASLSGDGVPTACLLIVFDMLKHISSSNPPCLFNSVMC